ncbi:MAG: hypothetical protein SF339_22360 [Blastocatellia bacterium]|nr:hypothetical protein [Blastocatellia bacterium]
MRFYPIARTVEGWGDPGATPSQPVTGRAPTAVITRVLKARFGSHLLADVKRAVGRWTVFRSDRGRRVALHVEMNKTTLDGLVAQMQAAGVPEGTCIELCADFGYLGQAGHRRVHAVKFKAWRKEGDPQWRGGECASPKWVARRCRGQAPRPKPPAPPISGYFAEPPDQMGYYGEIPDAIDYVYETPEVNGYGACDVGYVADPPPGVVEGYGYYAEAPEFAGVGYVYEAPDPMGYYAEGPEMGYYAEAPEQMGYYAEAPEMGYYAEAPEQMGYYAEAPEMGYYAEAPEQMGYFAEGPEMGYYAEAPEQMGYYAETPDVMGYDEAPEMGYFAESPIEGYVRDRDPAPRVAPLENINGVEGYYRPRSINPTCDNIRPAEDEPRPGSVWFQPLW